jgi:hypothetical protein
METNQNPVPKKSEQLSGAVPSALAASCFTALFIVISISGFATAGCRAQRPEDPWTPGISRGTAEPRLVDTNAVTKRPPGDTVGFERDGETDIIWQRQGQLDTDLHYWMLRDHRDPDKIGIRAVWNSPHKPTTHWQIVSTADFNRDGHTDLLWRDPETGRNHVWFLKGLDVAGNGEISPGHVAHDVVGTGDFNNDGHPDILWRNRTINELSVWFMGPPDGTNVVGHCVIRQIPRNPGWTASGVGDINNDGHSDIIWRDMTPADGGRVSGQVAIWLMDGCNVAREVELSGSWFVQGTDWKLLGGGIFNRIGNTDLLWRRQDGVTLVWRMQGPEVLYSSNIDPEPNLWEGSGPLAKGPEWTFGGVRGHTNMTMLTADVATSPATVTLRWLHGPTKVAIQKRASGNPGYVTLPATIDGDGNPSHIAPAYTDRDVSAGQRYEYKVEGAYIYVGVDASVRAVDENRGKVIMLVENSVATGIPAAIARLKDVLAADGWRILQRNVSPSTSPRDVRNMLKADYTADQANVNTIFILGHVPVPYSGNPNPDAHGARALPADGFYGDMDGNYTYGAAFVSSLWPEPRHQNTADDDKPIENIFPGNGLELAVGRVDFANMPALGRGELRLIEEYIAKNERYRRGTLPRVLPQRLIVGPTHVVALNQNSFSSALANATRFWGTSPENIVLGDALQPGAAAAWAIHTAYSTGGYQLVRNSTGSFASSDFVDPARQPHIHYLAVRASYIHDWDSTNNFMRAFLCSAYGLAVFWYSDGMLMGDVPLAFERLGLGDTIGNEFRRTINQSGEGWEPFNRSNTYLSLMGDPTLRLQVIKPPGNPSASSGTSVTVSWTASGESGVSYLIERAVSADYHNSSWIRLGTTTGTLWRDETGQTGPKTYRIRAIKQLVTGSGSYQGLSQGILAKTAM